MNHITPCTSVVSSPIGRPEITRVCVNFQNFLCAYVYLSSLHCPLLWTANPWTRLSCVCFFFFSQQLVLVFMFTLKWKKNLLYFSAPKHPPGICLVPALSLSPSRCSGPGPVRTRVHRGAALGCWKPSCRRTHTTFSNQGRVAVALTPSCPPCCSDTCILLMSSEKQSLAIY